MSVRTSRAAQPAPAAPAPSALAIRRFADGDELDRLSQDTLADAVLFADAGPDRLAVVGYDRPNTEQIAELASAMQLHPLIVEDLLNAGQRPKVERYGDVLFVVARAAEYVDSIEEVAFSEIHVLARGNVVAILCQTRETPEPWDPTAFHFSRSVRALGAEAVVYAVLDSVVDGYKTVIRGLDVDKQQIERQVFTGESGVAERIYRLSREVIDLQHAALPLDEVVDALGAGFGKYEVPEELQAYLQDVSDHLARVNTRVTDLRDALNQILNVNATLVTQRQNEDMKKISGWAAILFAPTLIGAVYGMNFDEMPELHWTFGYPMAVAAMVALGVGLWFLFRWKKWM